MSDAKPELVKKKKLVKKVKPAEDAATPVAGLPATAPTPAPKSPAAARTTTAAAPTSTPAPPLASVQSAPRTSVLDGESTKRYATRASSNVFAMFSPSQIEEFKEIFNFVDQDKDGILSKDDIRSAFDQVGRLTSDGELNEMLREATGPINFVRFLQLFGERVGGLDEEDIIFNAFTAFDEGDGYCSEDKLRKIIATFCESLSEKELEDVFNEAPMDSQGRVDLRKWANSLTTAGVEKNQ